MADETDKKPPPKGTFGYYKWHKLYQKKQWNQKRTLNKRNSRSGQLKELSSSKSAVKKRAQRLNAQEKRKQKLQSKIRQREYLKRYRQKDMSAEIYREQDFKHRMERSRAIKTLKESLPQTPGRRVSLLKTYLKNKSPTIKTLEKMNIVRSPEEIEKYCVTERAIKDIKAVLDETKTRRSTESSRARKIIYLAISGENVKGKRNKKKLANTLGIKRKNMTAGIRARTRVLKGETSCWRLTEKKNRNDNIPEAHKKRAYDFWLKSGVSRPTGNKKDIKRERLDTRVYVSHMVHVLEKSQTEVYSDFRASNPEIKMSQRTFERLKPFFVRAVRPGDRNTCLCRYHVELKTVFDCCMKERKKMLDHENCQTFDSNLIFRNPNDAVSSTLCPQVESEEYHNIRCLKRECELCGVQNFKLMEYELGDQMVDWEKFEYVTVSSKGSQVRKKLMLVKKNTCAKELFTYFVDLLSSFPAHQFRATWQRQQLKTLTANLPMADCTVIHDFSENYRIAGKDELQSSYFQRTEVSLHVSIIYHHAVLEMDEIDSTTDDPKIITEQFLVFSNDDKHDHHFVHKVQEMIRNYLASISYKVKTMHEFTDGCQAQYRSRHCIGDVSYSCEDFGYRRIIRNYSETSHAKGPQDAAGGYIKRQLDLAILRGTAVINTAEDACAYASENLIATSDKSGSARRIIRYLDKSNVERNRDRYFQPVLKNRDIHQIISDEEGLVTARSLSCYTCDNCADGLYETCRNSEITSARKVRLERAKSAQRNEPLMDTTKTVAETVRKGDLVAVFTDDIDQEYYLMKASHNFGTLNRNEHDDWNNIFPKDTPVIRGKYYDKTGPLTYKIIAKKSALICAHSVLGVLTDIKATSKLVMPDYLHEHLLSWVDECSNCRLGFMVKRVAQYVNVTQ